TYVDLMDSSGGTGGDTPFTPVANALNATVAVNAQNDHPTLIASPTPNVQFAAVDEDAGQTGEYSLTSTTVLGMLTSDTGGANIETLFAPGAQYGIAVTGVNVSTLSDGVTPGGTWKFSLDGTTWTAINPATTTSSAALLLAGGDLVEFVPNPGFNTVDDAKPSLTFIAWDMTFDHIGWTPTSAGRYANEQPGNTVDLTTGTGDDTPFGAIGNAVTATVGVNPQNDSPSFPNPSVAVTFPSILEGTPDASNGGSTVLSMITSDTGGSNIETLDLATPGSGNHGIAIIGATQTNHGTWEYQISGTGTWTPFPTVSSSNALLLDGNDLVRFSPNQYFNSTAPNQLILGGAPTLSFIAWDESFDHVGWTSPTSVGRYAGDVRGGAVNLNNQSGEPGTGDDTPFSALATPASASLTVTAVDNAPVVNLISGSISTPEIVT
ncbi:MAG: hypothetical protein ACREHD_09435, partial [Pirellulales bacterium]